MDAYAQNNDFEVCPYNESHRIQKGHKFQKHLIDCAKNFPNVRKTNCPFNYSHQVNIPELKYHIMTCPDRHSVAKKITKLSNERDFVPPVQLMSLKVDPDNVRAPCDENWDTELLKEPIQVPTLVWNNQEPGLFNPDQLSGLKRSQRKKIRKNISHGRDIFYTESEDEEKEEEEEEENEEEQMQQKLKHKQKEQEKLKPKSQQQSESKFLPQIPSPNSVNVLMDRKLPPGLSPNRIAANIFGRMPYHMSPIVDPMTKPMPIGLKNADTIGMGRGVALSRVTQVGMARGRITSIEQETSLMAGLGRGISIRLPAVQRLERKDVVSNLETKISEVKLDSKDERMNRVEESDSSEEAKKIRRLEKKLRQIENLLSKQEEGAVLNHEEVEC